MESETQTNGVQKRQQTESEKISNEKLLTEKQFDGYMARLWLVMAETWGHRWTSQMGEEPNGTWKDKLRLLTQEQWLRGITRLKACQESWPPSAPDFYRWCVGGLTQEEAKRVARREWSDHVDRLTKSYSPWGTPLTYDQIERQKPDFIARRMVELEAGPEAAGSIGFDPLRICPDEDYR